MWEIRTTYAQTWTFSSEGFFMYPLARLLIVPLHALHITPNMITVTNVLLVGTTCSYALFSRRWASAIVLVFLHQLLDAMDGTMARAYNLQSEFGAKLDEYTDIVFGVLLATSALGCAWPNPVMCATLVCLCFAMLYGELAYANAMKRQPHPPRYVEELQLWELVGLWGLENMTYNMYGISFLLYVSTEAEAELGWMANPADLVPSISLQTTAATLGALALGLAVVMKTQAAQQTPPSPMRPTKAGTKLNVRVLNLNFFLMVPGLFMGTRKDLRMEIFWREHGEDYDVLCLQEVRAPA
jgi:phosphatidylglycerophosphate synthase